MGPHLVWRTPSGVTEGRNSACCITELSSPSVAAALRGGRGSQPRLHLSTPGARGGWRSPSGAAEDRNPEHTLAAYEAVMWRSPSGAAEDRNDGPAHRSRYGATWRSGGRGSQRHGHRADQLRRVLVAVAFRGAEDRNPGCTSPRRERAAGGGRPPGRPRIATTPRTGRCRRCGGVAVALRGGRGSQRAQHRGGARDADGGGRPPGRPRIATRRSWVRRAVVTWRPPSGATEDRNTSAYPSRARSVGWRPPSGATEDCNSYSVRPAA
jgi:hypothetical protein